MTDETNKDDHRRLALQEGYINGFFAAFAALVETQPANRQRALSKELKRQSEVVLASMLADDLPESDLMREGFEEVISTLSQGLQRKLG